MQNSTDPKPHPTHPHSCRCGGTGLIPGEPYTHANGVTYTNMQVRCPGILTAPEVPVDRKKRAAGDTG